MKITVKSRKDSLGSGAYPMEADDVNHLIGELLTLVEMLGLKDSQEKSTKDLIRQKVWGYMENQEFIDSGLMSVIRDIKWQIDVETKIKFAKEQSKEDMEKGIHPPWLEGEYELTFTEVEKH